MGFNDYLSPLVNVEGATSINTILLVDVDVESFSSYIYVPTLWAKHTKTTVRGSSSLENPSCSKLDFSPPSHAATGELSRAPSCTLCCCCIIQGYRLRTASIPEFIITPVHFDFIVDVL